MNTNIELPLRDIHLPDAISWWPLALGWWLSLIGILLLIILASICIKKLFQPTLKKHAAKTLDSIEKAFHTNADATQCLRELSIFLRRVVLSQTKKNESAGLTGMDWLILLDQKLDKPEFSQGVGRLLLNGPYQPHIESDDISQLIELCRKWINRL